ncbi:hypothetical protein K8R03_00625 [Candidatus Kaiserbacteria bacterium]|nr:hypothetical protein [Candidatus Kaiserbacteria bacterium]
MSWASQRRFTYGFGTVLFFIILIGGPLAYHFLTIPATCSDGIQNQGETAIDKGGPCPLLDSRTLSPYVVLWSRSFHVRDGSYNSVAYIQNPNEKAGIRDVSYRFGLYDANNVLIAERTGSTFIMPGTITPIFEGAIDTGNRIVAHTYFEFTQPLTWERLDDTSSVVTVNNRQVSATDSAPNVSAVAMNTSVRDMRDITFVTVAFDPAGNAFAASQTTTSDLPGGESQPIVFTWPDPFNVALGSIDIIARSAPVSPRPQL